MTEHSKAWIEGFNAGREDYMGNLTVADAIEAADEIKRLRLALELIAESHDSGRGDGLPEPCPAHDDVMMWGVARAALAPKETADE